MNPIYDITKEEVLAHAQPKPERAVGIYFLIHKGEIVYVGQSNDIDARIATHARGDKEFDSFACLLCDPDEINELEAEYIVRFNPKYNGNLPFNKTWAADQKVRAACKQAGIAISELRKFIEEKGVRHVNGYYRIADFADLVAVSG